MKKSNYEKITDEAAEQGWKEAYESALRIIGDFEIDKQLLKDDEIVGMG